MVWCDNQWLIPSGFAYKDNLTQEEEEQAWSAIQSAKWLEVMWDDNDEHANKIAQAGQNLFVNDQTTILTNLDESSTLPREVVGLLKRSRASSLWCHHTSTFVQGSRQVSLAFLKVTTFTEMCLINVLPTDWSDCVKIQKLSISMIWRVEVPLGIGCLSNLRRLTLDGVELLPQHFEGLNLAALSFGRSKQMELCNLVPHLVKMPNLEALSYYDNLLETNTLIPTGLGNLVSLKILHLKQNRFVGSIPSELGQLTNLTRLTIREYAGLDLTCPEEVLNLNLAELVVERPQDQ